MKSAEKQTRSEIKRSTSTPKNLINRTITDRISFVIIIALLAGVIAAAYIIFSGKGGSIPCTRCGAVNVGWLLPLVIIYGLADGINPCAFAVLIFFVSFLLAAKKTRLDIWKTGLTYVGSLYTAYLLIGLGLLNISTLFVVPHMIGKIGAILCITLGLINVKDYFWYEKGLSLRVPSISKSTIINLIHKVTIPLAAIIGGVVGLLEFPCSGVMYPAIIGLLGTQTTYWQGLLYLLIYNLMFVTPLFIILLVASNWRAIGKIRKWQESKNKYMKLVSGLMLIDLGLIFFGIF
jgi:cytochrome c biogenesis protein CcdA